MSFDVTFLLGSFLVLGITYYFLYVKNAKHGPRQQQPLQPQQQPRQQQQQQPQPQQQQQQAPSRGPVNRRQVDSDSDSGDDGPAVDSHALEQQAKREAKRQRKEQQQQYVRQQIEMIEKKNQQRSKEFDEKQRLLEQKELEEEEWRKKIEEEQKRKEQDDFDKWKNSFQVEEQGNLKASAEEEDRRNAEFLQRLTRHIQLRKVVQLEEVSAEFGTTTADIVDKIKALEQMRELNGLIDERGKYIYLKQTEIDAIINFINAKGRLTRQELLSECNQLIKLEPSRQDQQLIKEEEEKLLEVIQDELQQQ